MPSAMELFLILLLLLFLSLWGIQLIRNSEKILFMMDMARQTAHQLAREKSSLLDG